MGKKAAMPVADEEAQKMQTVEEEEKAEEKDQEEEPAQEKGNSESHTERHSESQRFQSHCESQSGKHSESHCESHSESHSKSHSESCSESRSESHSESQSKGKPRRPRHGEAEAEPKGEANHGRGAHWRVEERPCARGAEQAKEEEEEEEEPDLKQRDRSKQNKFNVLLAAGAVPASMRKEWEALKTAGSRKNQSKFIEDMVVRDERTGRLALSCDKGSLEALVGLSHKSRTGWGDTGLNKTLFKGKFGLTDEMLRQAILDDEVQVKTQDGVAFCQWRELKEEHMDEMATDAKLALDPKKVSGQQAAQMATLFDSVSMERPDPSAEDLAADSGAAQCQRVGAGRRPFEKG